MKRLYARLVLWLINPALERKSQLRESSGPYLIGIDPSRDETMPRFVATSAKWRINGGGRFEFNPDSATPSAAPSDPEAAS